MENTVQYLAMIHLHRHCNRSDHRFGRFWRLYRYRYHVLQFPDGAASTRTDSYAARQVFLLMG